MPSWQWGVVGWHKGALEYQGWHWWVKSMWREINVDFNKGGLMGVCSDYRRVIIIYHHWWRMRCRLMWWWCDIHYEHQLHQDIHNVHLHSLPLPCGLIKLRMGVWCLNLTSTIGLVNSQTRPYLYWRNCYIEQILVLTWTWQMICTCSINEWQWYA